MPSPHTWKTVLLFVACILHASLSEDDPKRGSFKIDDGAVIGAGTYEMKDDGVDVEIQMKIAKQPSGPGTTPSEGSPGEGAGTGNAPGGGEQPSKPALCPMPCPAGVKPGQTVTPKPSEGPGKGTNKPVPTSSPGSSPSTGGGPGGSKPTSSVTPSGGGGGFDAVQEEALKAHNDYRARHDAPPMALNKDLSMQAEEWAKYLGENDIFEHAPSDKRKDQGENIASWCDSKAESGTTVTKRWYDEVCDPGYDFNRNDMDWSAGHFTQVVWKESTELGIGYFDKKRDDGFVCRTFVGRYRPPGNYGGKFLENVKKGSFDKSKHCTDTTKRSSGRFPLGGRYSKGKGVSWQNKA